jgi:hypothetical protein
VVADLCADEPASDPWRWLVLISELPDDSATAASMAAWLDANPDQRPNGKPAKSERDWRGWGHDRHLLAAIFDAVQANTVVTARVAGAKKVRAPKPWPRPGSQRSSHAGMTSMRSLLAQRRGNPGSGT